MKDWQPSMHFYDLSEQIQKEIIHSLELEDNKEFVLSYSRFVDFTVDHHSKLLDHVFNTVVNNIQENKTQHGLTYTFVNPDLFLVSLDDLVFI